MSKQLGTQDIWRAPSFYSVVEFEEWLRRDYYGNDVEGILSILDEMEEFVRVQRMAYNDAVERNK